MKFIVWRRFRCLFIGLIILIIVILFLAILLYSLPVRTDNWNTFIIYCEIIRLCFEVLWGRWKLRGCVLYVHSPLWREAVIFKCLLSFFPFSELHLNEDSEASKIAEQWGRSSGTEKDDLKCLQDLTNWSQLPPNLLNIFFFIVVFLLRVMFYKWGKGACAFALYHQTLPQTL